MRSIVIFRFFSHLSLLFVYQCITFLPLIFRFSFYSKDRDSKYIYGPGMPRSYFVGCKISY